MFASLSSLASLNRFSTDHFWYRQPSGVPYIDSQRSNKAFGFADGTIFLSEDNGRTWPHSIAFPDAQNITYSYILNNGNLLFGTGSQLYFSTDNLKTYQPITVKDVDGSDYIPHTPQNPDQPGWYFHTLMGVNSWDVNGVEIDAGVGELLQRPRRCGPGQHLLLNRQRAHRKDRVCLRTESLFSG